MADKFLEIGTRALVVDDEETSNLILSSILKDLGYIVQSVQSVEAFNREFEKKSFDLVFMDYQLGESNGLELLRLVSEKYPEIPGIMITAHGTIELATEAMTSGARGFITKPFDQAKVVREIDRATRWDGPHSITTKVERDITDTGIIGSSPATLRIIDQINRMKDAPTTVLINGESGTGKELIAKALHFQSKRKSERFEAVNCAAIPETLLEAELFGYKKGAFTDAKKDRKGLFETCSQGTLFLDEIGEMPLHLQSKLLRVLQEKLITPLGSSSTVKVETRVVAATNRSLVRLIAEDKFRKDLYYRLSILQIESPPLRDRAEDIPVLANFFVEELSKNLHISVNALSAEIMTQLEAYDWPGNIRELQNSLERAIVLSADKNLCIDDIFSKMNLDTDIEESSSGSLKSLTDAKDEFEKSYLEKVLRLSKGNVSHASKMAGRVRTDLYRLFTKHNLDPQDFKPH